MPKKGENIYKRKDKRWEARYIRGYKADGSARYGYCYAKTYREAREKLIAAKADPTLFPNLVVRVWGFSAYFNDLPEEYKDVLIARALESEKAA